MPYPEKALLQRLFHKHLTGKQEYSRRHQTDGRDDRVLCALFLSAHAVGIKHEEEHAYLIFFKKCRKYHERRRRKPHGKNIPVSRQASDHQPGKKQKLNIDELNSYHADKVKQLPRHKHSADKPHKRPQRKCKHREQRMTDVVIIELRKHIPAAVPRIDRIYRVKLGIPFCVR